MNRRTSFEMNCLEAALDCARRGWHVFPATTSDGGVKKGCIAGEHGNGRRWGNTTGEALIRDYWRRFPDAMLGIACGADSGLFVVEADTLEGHAVDGVGNLRRLFETHGALPDTITAVSPSGSLHLYFRWPEDGGIANSAGHVAQGIDVRGEGGMVIAPPSVRPDKPRPYEWKNPPGLFDLAPCPEWLLSLFREPRTIADIHQHAVARAVRRIAADVGNANDQSTGPAEVAELLGWIDPDAGGYQSWLKVLMALHNHFGGSGTGLALAEEWSAQGAKFKPGEVGEKWAGFSAGGGVTLGTVAELARQNGADLSGIARRHRARTAPRKTDEGDAEVQPIMPDSSAVNVNEIDLSHDTLARELGRRGWDRDAKYFAVQGQWYLWDGTRWGVDHCLRHMTLAREFLGQRAAEVLNWADREAANHATEEAEKLRSWASREARTLRCAPTVTAVAGLARSNRASVATSDSFDSDLYLLGTPGGTVDRRTGQLRPARREDMITKLTSVAPAPPGMRAPNWQQFLTEVMDGDADNVGFLQRAAGYALTGLTTEHKLLFLYGTGRNGKSTFLEMLQWLWGGYARRAAATTFLSSVGERHPTDLAGLSGARLVVGSELPKGKVWDEAVLKDLTGGDKMTARFMRGDFFDFVPQLTLMIAGNTMPSLRGVDEALRARLVLVPFTVTIPTERRDPTLPEKLRREGPAILRWAIDGALEWQRRGLAVPEKVAAASMDYLDGEDVLGQFLTDETAKDAGAFTYTQDLHARFKQWTDRQGLTGWTSHTLTKEMMSRGFENSRRTKGRGFLGLRLV